MLPSPPPPIVEQALSRNSISRIVARESSVVLELSSRKVNAVMEECPELARAYKHNTQLWQDALTPERLSRHWLFASCPPRMVDALASRWSPRVYPEGSVIARNEDMSGRYCLLVLSGTVLFKKRMACAPDIFFERVGSGAILNGLALVREPDEAQDFYGEIM